MTLDRIVTRKHKKKIEKERKREREKKKKKDVSPHCCYENILKRSLIFLPSKFRKENLNFLFLLRVI